MFKTILLIGLGGGTGSIFRYLVSQWSNKIAGTTFPWGTFLVNFTGCLLIGLVIQMTQREGDLGNWRLLLATGFCGGFTTFSAFAYENLKMLEVGNYQAFILYTVGSIIAGILGVMIGMR